MTQQPSTGSSGVAWVVLWIKQVPVRDQHGRLLAEPWNPRVALRGSLVAEIDTLYADTKTEALAEARRLYPPNAANEIEVVSRLSYAIGLEDREVIRKSRISPRIASTKRRRTVHAEAP